MKNPPSVKVGDRVRVEIEGTVTHTGAWSTDYFELTPDGGAISRVKVWPNMGCFVSITQAPAPPIKVGDVLSSQEDYDRAPYGTVIFRDAGAPLVKRIGRWDCGCGSCDVEHRYILGSVPRTVIYVPEATQ